MKSRRNTRRGRAKRWVQFAGHWWNRSLLQSTVRVGRSRDGLWCVASCRGMEMDTIYLVIKRGAFQVAECIIRGLR